MLFTNNGRKYHHKALRQSKSIQAPQDWFKRKAPLIRQQFPGITDHHLRDKVNVLWHLRNQFQSISDGRANPAEAK